MNCKRVEKLILTDYIDGNLKGRALEKIEAHLGSCPGCRALADELRGASKLFRAVGRQEAPAGIWHKIRDDISAISARRYFPETALEYLRYHLSRLRPAVVIASAAVLLIFIFTAVRLIPQKNSPESSSGQNYINAISYNGDGESPEEYDLGTSAEMFFL